MNRLRITKDNTEDEIGGILEQIRQGLLPKSLLIELLSERHFIYKERPSYQMRRIRGYALASFSDVGLPDSAINFVLEELQNGRDAYTVAGAARGLRGVKRPRAEYVSYLIQAIVNLRYHDDSLDLSVFKPTWPLKNPSSGLSEVLRTLGWLQGYAKSALPELKSLLHNTKDFPQTIQQIIRLAIDAIEADERDLDLSCCKIKGIEKSRRSLMSRASSKAQSFRVLEVEDEYGKLQPLGDIITQKPSVVAFFYTRCMNPNKCTLTINKLGYLQNLLINKHLENKVNILAFTYDPSFDTPNRMRAFGKNRGVSFDSNAHFLRTLPEDFSTLSDFFKLGVNHVASTVNQHRLELFLLNQRGNIEIAYTRLQWDVDEVACDVSKLINNSSRRSISSTVTNFGQQVIWPILLVLFPKCPVCWTGYLSVFGVSSISSIPYSPWLSLLMVIVIIFNLLTLFRKSKSRNGFIPFWVSFTGSLLVGAGYIFSNKITSICGISLIFIGAMLNSLSYQHWSKLSFLIMLIFKRVNPRVANNQG